MENALNSSTLSYLYRYVMDEIAAVAIFNKDKNFNYINDSFTDLFEYEFSATIGKEIGMLMSGVHPDIFWLNLWEVVDRGHNWKGEVCLKSKSGTFVWVEAVLIPIMKESGKVDRILSVFFDKTEKKRGEDLLKIFVDKSHQLDGVKFFESVIQEITTLLQFDFGMIAEYFEEENKVSSLSLVLDGEVVPNISYNLDGTPCKVCVESKKSAFFPQDVQGWFPDDKDLVKMGIESYVGLPLLNRENKVIGLVVFLSRKAVEIEKIDSSLHILEIFHRFLSQELEKNKSTTIAEKQKKVMYEMEKLSSLGAIAAFMGHEINNSLQVILGSVQRVQKELVKEEQSEEKISKSLNTIKRVSHNMGLIIKGIKGMAHTDKETDVLDHKEMDISNSIEESLAMVNIKNKTVGAALQIPSLKDLKISGNPVQITQIFTNLLTNSLDAVENENDKWIKLDFFESPGYYRFNVIDSGPPIPKDIKEKMMKEFFTTKPVGKGTGLGLAVVKRLVSEHGGEFNLNSENKNTCFEFSFPKFKCENVA